MAFKVIEAPNKFKADSWKNTNIFLAGGISGCPNWQEDAIRMMNEYVYKSNDVGIFEDYTILNPRRENFDTANEAESVNQINWEYKALAKAKCVLFWFPKETLCPITLLELGKELMRKGRYERSVWNLHVGCHPDYKRKLDVQIQVKLAKKLDIHFSLEDTVNALMDSI